MLNYDKKEKVFDLVDLVHARRVLNQSFADLELMCVSSLDIQDAEIIRTEEKPPLRIRIYNRQKQGANIPALLYIHAGGFVAGSIEGENSLAGWLAEELNTVVISLQYRLAPECPYPAPLVDCYDALSWVQKNSQSLGVSRQRIGVFGIGSGGGMAAALGLYCRDKGYPGPNFQCLICPQLDDRLLLKARNQQEGAGWSRKNLILSWDLYLRPLYQCAAANVPYYAAPSRALNLSGLAPTYLCTMETDPLRDEGLKYGAKLLQDGVSAEIHNFSNCVHNTAELPKDVNKQIMSEVIHALKKGLGL